MVKDILKTGIKNLIGVPLIQVQSQTISDSNIPSNSQRILKVGVDIQSLSLALDNYKLAKKKLGRSKF